MKKQGKIAPGTDVALAGSGVAIAVKAGAPKPDISTPEALKQTLLKAKSIAYSEPSAGGASGVYFAKLLERMGIAESDEAEDQISAGGRFFAANCLLTGEAELAVQQKPELLHVAGTEIVGFLPGDLNMVTEFAAGIMPEQQECRRGESADQNAAIAGSESGVPRQGTRSGLSRYVANVNAYYSER